MDPRQWQQTVNGQAFFLSTTHGLPHPFIQKAFATEAMYWAKPIPDAHLTAMLDNSCMLGLHRVDEAGGRTPIGMARLVTDYVTLAYLTDVYVEDEYRGLGLGQWMIRCCREFVADMPELRWMILLTGSEQAEKLYRRELGMVVMGKEEKLSPMGARKAQLRSAAEATVRGGPSAAGPDA